MKISNLNKKEGLNVKNNKKSENLNQIPKNIQQTPKKIQLPTNKETITDLNAGDVIYISGIIATGRDLVHKKIIDYVDKDKPLPKHFEKLKGSAIFHMGPIIKENKKGEYEIVSGGPTTSSRMNKFQTSVNEIIGNHFVIGKGGMKGVSWEKTPAVYLQYPGGVGAITAKFVKKVIGVEWKELGPEAAWFLKVENFGPLLVAIDSHGNSLYKKH